ncbi:hypothetical protein, partial [Kaarinaea lacus]
MRYAFLLLLAFTSTTAPVSSSADPLPISDNFTVEYVLEAGLFTIGNTRRTLNALDNGLYVFE